MRMRGFDFVRSCTCNTVFELLACFITVVLLYVLFCYFNDLIWWCGWYIGYSKQVSKGTVDSELLMKHGKHGHEIWTDWGESYWCLKSRYMSYFHVQILKRSWNRDNLAVECAKGIPLRRSGMTKHSNGNLEGRYPTWTNMDKFGWWSSVCTICTNPISSMVLGFQTWFLLACSTIRIWGAFFSFPLLHFLTLPLFLAVAKKSWKNIPGFVWSSVQVVLRRWRVLQLWWSAISVVYGWGEEISAWTSAAWLKALKGAVRFQETASFWCFFRWSLALFTCFFHWKIMNVISTFRSSFCEWFHIEEWYRGSKMQSRQHAVHLLWYPVVKCGLQSISNRAPSQGIGLRDCLEVFWALGFWSTGSPSTIISKSWQKSDCHNIFFSLSKSGIFDFHQSVPFLLTAFGLSPLELSWTWAAAMLSWSFAQCKRMTEKATLKNIRRIQNNMNIMSFLVSCHIHMDIHMISYWIFNDIMIFICGVLCWTEAGDCTWQS